MRIRHFHIDRFGILAGQKAENLAPGLNIFLGDNEAGKSTCRDFLRAMFFGYKRGGRNDLDYARPISRQALRASADGGGLLLELDDQGGQGGQSGSSHPNHKDARAIRLLRRPGKHGGELMLYDAQGRELSSGLWTGLLSGVTADLYDKVFAFDLQDLANLASLGGPQVSAALHGAAFGTGFRSPAEVLQNLEKSRKELFSPSPTAKIQAINKILQRLREIRRQIKENGSDIERHAALAREEAELRAALAERQTAREALERELGRVNSLLGAWELWTGWQQLEGELALRPQPGGEFGPDSLTRLEALCAERAEKLAALEAREEELAELERQLAEERAPQDLLNLEAPCRALAGERDNAALALRGIPALEAELESLEREQEKLLAELGGNLPDETDEPGETGESGPAGRPWSRRAALGFDCSPGARARVEVLGSALTAACAEVEQAAREEARLKRELERAELEEARLRAARAAPGASSQAAASSFGPEMRLLLEEKGRALEHSRQAAAESGKERLQLEREEARLQTALEARRKDISGLAKITCREEDLQERRQELTTLRRVAEQTEAEAAEAALLAAEAARRRPSLLSFTSLRQDPRRAAPAALALLLAVLLLYPLATALAAGQDWQSLLAGNGWATALFGLGSLWAALFWLFPSLALLGLYHPAPSALQARLVETLNRLAGHRQELLRRAERLNAWLPEPFPLRPPQAGAPYPGETAEALANNLPEPVAEATLNALPAFYRRLESFFSAQQDQLLRLQLARLQEGQERERAAALAIQLEEARQAERAAEAKLARDLTQWENALAPYALGADCAPDAALQIFDRTWRSAEARAALAEGRRLLAAAQAARQEAGARWGAWLGATPFSGESSPGAVLDAFNRLGRFKELQIELERRQERLKSLHSSLADFERELLALLERLAESRRDIEQPGQTDTATGAMTGTPIQLFDRLLAATEAATRQEALCRQRQRDLRALQSRRTEGRSALAECEAALRQLFDLAGIGPGMEAEPEAESGEALNFTAGAEEFRLRFAAYRERRDLQLERDRLALQLEQRGASALWRDQEEFKAALQAAEPEVLSAGQAELREKLEQAAKSREEGLTRLGEVRAGLAALAEGEGSAGLRREEAALREELEGLARRWSVLTLAQAFILQAKRSFEEERQDLVVRQAGDFFRAMTLGRYQGLLFDLEKGRGLKASAVAAGAAEASGGAEGGATGPGLGGLNLDSEEALSRGTREQLYLALRLAYVRQHNQSRESLPLVMDDILVNFDPERAARTAGILAEFAAANQILFFTCHPQMAELLSQAAGSAAGRCARYRVERGEILPG